MRIVIFTDLNISKFLFLKFRFMSYQLKGFAICNNQLNSNIANMPLAKWQNSNSYDNSLPVGYKKGLTKNHS